MFPCLATDIYLLSTTSKQHYQADTEKYLPQLFEEMTYTDMWPETDLWDVIVCGCHAKMVLTSLGQQGQTKYQVCNATGTDLLKLVDAQIVARTFLGDGIH